MSRPAGEAAGDILSGSHRRQTLLQEVFTSDYNVTEEGETRPTRQFKFNGLYNMSTQVVTSGWCKGLVVLYLISVGQFLSFTWITDDSHICQLFYLFKT